MARKTPNRVRVVAVRQFRGRRGRCVKPGEECWLPPGAARARVRNGTVRHVKVSTAPESKGSGLVDDPDALAAAEEKANADDAEEEADEYVCPVEGCGKSYDTKRWFDRHMESKHPDEV